MKAAILSLSVALIYISLNLTGCAAYKQLEPEPLIVPQEQVGFTKIKKGEKEFILKKGKKYFMEFPLPPEKNFYLVLESSELKEHGMLSYIRI